MDYNVWDEGLDQANKLDWQQRLTNVLLTVLLLMNIAASVFLLIV